MWWWIAAAALADEGMWEPHQVAEMASEWRDAGLQLDASTLGTLGTAPLGAIAHLGQFCSASFVSADGLILTNHHCAEGMIAALSSGERNLLDLGFTAASAADELPARSGVSLLIPERIDDVTDRVRTAVRAAPDGPARARAFDKVASDLVAACERAPHRRCRLASFDGGLRYRLIRQLEIRDLRIVHAPPAAVGFFGGDRDNFEWPRHDGDYTFLRAWVGPDGAPAAYSADNIPYRPVHHLTVDPTGPEAGDFVWVAGFPGRTQRNSLESTLRHVVEVEHPADLASYDEVLSILRRHAATSEEARARVQSTIFDLENDQKYTQGVQDNVASGPLLGRKRAETEALDAWIASHGTPDHAAAVATLRRLDAESSATFARDHVVHELMSLSLLWSAHTGWRWSQEQAKRPADRKPGWQARDRAELEADLEAVDDTLWMPAEADLARHALAQAAGLPADQRILPVDRLIEEAGGVEGAVRILAAATRLTSADERLALLDRPRKALLADPDPWLRLAVGLEEEVLAPERARSELRSTARREAYPRYVEALQAARGARVYADANNTLRLTFGHVQGYPVRDGLVATPQTTLGGLLAKHATDDYEAPPWLVEAAARRATSPYVDPALGDVPVGFLSDVDTTGGNSGSATLDARGRLVGLIFDGNYESMAADWQFDPRTTRSVHLDIRYILWLLSIDPNARWIHDELLRSAATR